MPAVHEGVRPALVEIVGKSLSTDSKPMSRLLFLAIGASSQVIAAHAGPATVEIDAMAPANSVTVITVCPPLTDMVFRNGCFSPCACRE